MSKAVD